MGISENYEHNKVVPIEVYLDAGNHDALTPHSRYIVDFLFCIIWVWLGLCPYSKSRFSSQPILRYCKLTILGTSDMPGHTSQKWYGQYQLMENFDDYLHAKKELHFKVIFLLGFSFMNIYNSPECLWKGVAL